MSKKVLWDSNSSLQGLDTQRELRELSKRVLWRLTFNFVAESTRGEDRSQTSVSGRSLQSPAGPSRGESIGSPRPETSQKQQACGGGVAASGSGGPGPGRFTGAVRAAACWRFAVTSPSPLATVPVLKGAGLRATMRKWMSNVRGRVCASEEDFW